jgi:putative flavoprotein involved in K+ transport
LRVPRVLPHFRGAGRLAASTRGGEDHDPGSWEGEQRNMWKPTQQESLWFHGGNLHQSRHYSLYLALQLKTRMEGLVTPVYGLQPVHHIA